MPSRTPSASLRVSTCRSTATPGRYHQLIGRHRRSVLDHRDQVLHGAWLPAAS